MSSVCVRAFLLCLLKTVSTYWTPTVFIFVLNSNLVALSPLWGDARARDAVGVRPHRKYVTWILCHFVCANVSARERNSLNVWCLKCGIFLRPRASEHRRHHGEKVRPGGNRLSPAAGLVVLRVRQPGGDMSNGAASDSSRVFPPSYCRISPHSSLRTLQLYFSQGVKRLVVWVVRAHSGLWRFGD